MDNFNWNSPPFNFVFFLVLFFWFEGALKLGKFSLSPLRQSPWPVADVDFSFECYWLQSCFYEIIGLKISQIVTDKHSFEFCWCPPQRIKRKHVESWKKKTKRRKQQMWRQNIYIYSFTGGTKVKKNITVTLSCLRLWPIFTHALILRHPMCSVCLSVRSFVRPSSISRWSVYR